MTGNKRRFRARLSATEKRIFARRSNAKWCDCPAVTSKNDARGFLINKCYATPVFQRNLCRRRANRCAAEVTSPAQILNAVPSFAKPTANIFTLLSDWEKWRCSQHGRTILFWYALNVVLRRNGVNAKWNALEVIVFFISICELSGRNF